jgi:hypothetical protein
MNKIIESINYASDAYWGDEEKFSFRAKIDSYTTSTELAQGSERAVKTNFTIVMNGHIIPDAINATLAGMNKYYSKSSVTFGLETAGTLETLQASSRTETKDSDYRFFDSGTAGVQSQGMTAEQLEYVATNNTLIANFASNNAAIFNNATILEVPNGFSSGAERFSLYINGQHVLPLYYTVSQTGTNITVVIQTGGTEYSLDTGDQIVLSGKIKTTT